MHEYYAASVYVQFGLPGGGVGNTHTVISLPDPEPSFQDWCIELKSGETLKPLVESTLALAEKKSGQRAFLQSLQISAHHVCSGRFVKQIDL